MFTLLRESLPDAWRGRALRSRAYTLQWVPLAIGAVRAPAEATVEDDFLPLYIMSLGDDPATGDMDSGSNDDIEITLELQGRQITAGRVHLGVVFDEVSLAFLAALPLVAPIPMYAGDQIRAELTNNVGAVRNHRLLVHGVEAPTR